jgi:hypothetical protein
MRTIEKQIWSAIHAKKSVTLSNSRVEYLSELNEPMHSRIEYAKVYLHGHHIASYTYGLDRVDYNPMTLAQWPTRTTKSRLRALGVNVYTKNGCTYVGDKLISVGV